MPLIKPAFLNRLLERYVRAGVAKCRMLTLIHGFFGHMAYFDFCAQNLIQLMTFRSCSDIIINM